MELGALASSSSCPAAGGIQPRMTLGKAIERVDQPEPIGTDIGPLWIKSHRSCVAAPGSRIPAFAGLSVRRRRRDPDPCRHRERAVATPDSQDVRNRRWSHVPILSQADASGAPPRADGGPGRGHLVRKRVPVGAEHEARIPTHRRGGLFGPVRRSRGKRRRHGAGRTRSSAAYAARALDQTSRPHPQRRGAVQTLQAGRSSIATVVPRRAATPALRLTRAW